MEKVTVKNIFYFKSKGIPNGENIKTVIGKCREYPEVVFIRHTWVCKKENKGEFNVLREGNMYALVQRNYEIQKGSLFTIAEALIEYDNE